MILRKTYLQNFRPFSEAAIELCDSVNLLVGKNGVGKTSILEAVYYLALTRSFRTTNDKIAIKDNTEYFNIRGTFTSKPATQSSVRVYFSNVEGKHLFMDESRILKMSGYIGKVPCVLLTPEDIKLTFGGPGIRRRFLDILLSQVNPVYLESLKSYRRIVQQRNALLMHQDENEITQQLDSWNAQLIDNGVYLIERRLDFTNFLNDNLTAFYRRFAEDISEISVVYKCSVSEESGKISQDQMKQAFTQKLKALRRFEFEKRTSAIGPHRDDLIFKKNGRTFRDFGSQGENKTLIIALKFLEWKYLSQQREASPILLLDDVFGELDTDRMDGLLHFLGKTGQAFITTTLEHKFDTALISKMIKITEAGIQDA